MDKIKENLETFLIIWGVILVLNQAVIFGGCFAPYCILAALPHTGFIAFILFILAIKSDKQETNFSEKNVSTVARRERPARNLAKDYDINQNKTVLVNNEESTKKTTIESEQQSELNQLNISYLTLVQQYYPLIAQKTKIIQTINNYEKNKFDSIGEITLKILELKQNDSYRSMEDYKSYFALYESHKRKDYHVDSSSEKFDTTFVSNIPAINNKIKDIQFKITMLQKELKILEDKDVYKLAKTSDSKSYFEKEKQKLQLELDALEAQNKSAKKFTLQELPFKQDAPFKVQIK